MFINNPFLNLAEIISPLAMQSFVILMIALVLFGTLIDIIHKKNVKYFFDNAKKAKKNAKIELNTSTRAAVILKTVAHDIATTSELGWGKRRLAHVLGMYGTILFLYLNPRALNKEFANLFLLGLVCHHLQVLE